jgi:hypothetical protein
MKKFSALYLLPRDTKQKMSLEDAVAAALHFNGR